mmetsp:Transcript_43151/g.101470  ORF Transcript_43151/g.101470 Transcript_43151/m.101470 type:complete len:154 (+) Transcript_43151:64-525(+)
MVFIIRQPEKDLGANADIYSTTTFHLNGLWQVLDATIPSAAEEALWGRDVDNKSFGLLTGSLTYRPGVGVVSSDVESAKDATANEWWQRTSSINVKAGNSPVSSPEKTQSSNSVTESSSLKMEMPPIPSVNDVLGTLQKPFRHANRGPSEQWN